MSTLEFHRSLLCRLPVSRLILLIIATLLAGCGGGGGGGGGGGDNDSNIVSGTTPTVTPNTTPTVSFSALTTNEDSPANGLLIASDSDGDPLTYSIVSNGSLGTAVITNPATGAFTYTPDPDENGTDSFTFKANDGLSDSRIATVSVSINAVNDSPVASGSCGTTFQTPVIPQPYESTFSAYDPDSPMLTYALIDPTDGSLAADGPIITAKGGTVTITNRNIGDFTYQPDPTAGDKRGTDSFEYQVTDTDGLSDMATEVVIVNQTIMPLGDSITAGRINSNVGPPVVLRGGYRKPLYDALTTTGFNVDFVGSVVHGQDLPDFDFNHEGHGGWSAARIAWGDSGYPIDGVRAWLDGNPADVVLLHAGTNGLAPDGSNDIDVEAILDEIDVWEESASGNPVTVILALIVDRNPINPDVAALNSNILAFANDRIANGDDIIIANHHDALTYPDDLGDTVHPNESGYAKMATVWFDHLSGVLDKCP